MGCLPQICIEDVYFIISNALLNMIYATVGTTNSGRQLLLNRCLNSYAEGNQCAALVFCLLLAWKSCRMNNRVACNLIRRHAAHVTPMLWHHLIWLGIVFDDSRNYFELNDTKFNNSIVCVLCCFHFYPRCHEIYIVHICKIWLCDIPFRKWTVNYAFEQLVIVQETSD